MAYTVKLGVGLNPTNPTNFIDFSSNSADGVALLGEPPFKWEAKEDDTTQVRRGTVPGKRNTAVVNNNAVFTLFLDLYASNQVALINKLDQVNYYLEQARLYDEYNGAVGAPIFLTIQMHNTPLPMYIQVIGGPRIGVDTGKLNDGTWLAAIGQELKIAIHCLPEIKGDKVTLYNTLPNGDFQNDNSLLSRTTYDFWNVTNVAFAANAVDGYYGTNCIKFTGTGAAASFQTVYSDFIPISALGLTAGTVVTLAAMMKCNNASAYGVYIRLVFYNATPTFVSQLEVTGIDSPSGITGARGWQNYYISGTIPSSTATQFRVEVLANINEPTTFSAWFDAFAIWVNQTTPPLGGEYMTISGNNICPSRVYNVQGNVPALSRVFMSPRNAVWATSRNLDTFETGISPHECGGFAGVNEGNSGFDKPIPFCRPTRVTTAGSFHYFNFDCTVDYTQRVYILKARCQGTAYTGLFYLQDATSTRVVDSSGNIGTTLGSFSLYTIYELNAFFSPDTMTAVTGGIESMNYGRTVTNTINVNCPNGANTVTISHLYFIRTDWGYGYVSMSSVNITAANWLVYDSTSGYVQISAVTNPWTNTQAAVDCAPDIRGSTLRLMPGNGIVNDIQVVDYYSQTNQNDFTDDYVTMAVEYWPKYKGLVRA